MLKDNLVLLRTSFSPKSFDSLFTISQIVVNQDTMPTERERSDPSRATTGKWICHQAVFGAKKPDEKKRQINRKHCWMTFVLSYQCYAQHV
jgi:hypothetical protein